MVLVLEEQEKFYSHMKELDVNKQQTTAPIFRTHVAQSMTMRGACEATTMRCSINYMSESEDGFLGGGGSCYGCP